MRTPRLTLASVAASPFAGVTGVVVVTLLTVVVVSGCGSALRAHGTIDVTGAGRGFTGLSVHGDTLSLVSDDGIVDVDRSGAVIDVHKAGEHGLVAQAYGDVSVVDIGDGVIQYALVSDSEGTLYDPATQTQASRFCVLPGGNLDPGPVLTERNDAVAVDGDTILTNPRFYDGDALQASTLRSYRLTDGTLIGEVNLEDKPALTGIAVTVDGILGVAGHTLHVLNKHAEKDHDVAFERSEPAHNATGVAVDSFRGELLVLEAAGAVAVYRLDEL